MGKLHDDITTLSPWIADQRMYFVATAPLSPDGLVNCSPKGLDTFRVLGSRDVAYLDLTGSGIETAAHLRENGRIVIMFCALTGPPRIVRLHGTGRVVTPHSAEYDELLPHFPAQLGARAIIRVQVNRISDSCGYSVPRYDYAGDRDVGVRWAAAKGEAGLEAYRTRKNAVSLDGLPGLDVSSPDS